MKVPSMNNRTCAARGRARPLWARPIPVAAALVVWCMGATAQEAGANRAVSTVWATLGTTVGYSRVSSPGGSDAGSEFVTRVSPGISWRGHSGRVVGSLDYVLNLSEYSRHHDAEPVEQALSSAVTVEAIPQWMYVDARAAISQQYLSAYGLQSASGSLMANNNRVDVLNVYVSPTVQRGIGDFAEVELKLQAGATNGYKSIAADSNTSGGSFTLRSPRAAGLLGWSLSTTQQRVDFRAGRQTYSDRSIASLSFKATPDLQLSARGGFENTDVGSLDRRRYDNWGLGLRWVLDERTRVSVDGDRRYFGNGHQVAIDHRMRHLVFHLASTRDATNSSDAGGVGRPVTLYQLYYSQFASIEPDPALRDARVREFLRLLGLNPNGVVAGGAVASAVMLQRRDDIAVAYNGQRTTFSLQGFSSATQVLDNPFGVLNDGPVRQRAVIATLAHGLTPKSSVSLSVSATHTLATAIQAATDLNSISLGLNSAVNPSTTANVALRHSATEGSATTAYRESALTASLNLRF